ncbi:cadherin-like protein 26 isoform X2 [Betta splendens]|uniref:Cadherin-like protein 26 isoform X2 n=1 Tax=Betta splendens TaxID=158456 RepID=A0A6P7N0T1_BETSP|nr:cadherin-like protein 26 isoform X2 [Betta splendens]
MLCNAVLLQCFGSNSSSSQMSQILQRHKRNWIIDSFFINESYNGPFPYSLGRIHIEKNFILFQIEGQGVNDEPKGIVRINEYTGELTVYGPVDHEKFKSLKLKFLARNKASGLVDTRLSIEITIIDENDNAPKFDMEIYQITIEESTTQGTDVITIKATDEDDSERNHKFDLRIVSITPKPQDLEFYLTQAPGSQFGRISFKGCLDHETAEKYTIIVEAKDRGLIQLSSSCTVIINIKDGNNHLPLITKQTGPATVKEGQENVLVKRLQVTDGDTKGTEAWRARFQIQGDANDDFNITTDADTNEGLLYVKKQLNFELGRVRNVSVAVENEIPFHSCKVESRNAIGLWGVSITSSSTGASGGRVRPATSTVTVTVEDVNEPPVFDQPNKVVHVLENAHPGQFLWKFTATDPDVASVNTVVYRKGRDPAGLVKVDRATGNITLVKAIDRESRYVKDNMYVASVCAVDNGKPPMTSTATLSVYVADENDNAPFLNASVVDMCRSDGASRATVTAVDLDGEPYGGPFTFRLLGDVEGKWKLDPEQGYSVRLVKENAVYSGRFELSLEVSDLQGKAAVHRLAVTVCSCLDAAQPNCRVRKPRGSAAGHAAAGTIILSIILFAGLLLLAFMVSCKKKSVKFDIEDSAQHLIKFNTEQLGTDCEVNVVVSDTYRENAQSIQTAAQVIMKQPQPPYSSTDREMCGVAQHDVTNTGNFVRQWVSGSETNVSFIRRHPSRWSMGASPASGARTRLERRPSARENMVGHKKYSHPAKYKDITALRHQACLRINKKLNLLQAAEAQRGDYAPRVYAEEGDAGTSDELDAISNPDSSFNLDFNEDSDVMFHKLASMCMPSQTTASSDSPPPTATSATIPVKGHKT